MRKSYHVYVNVIVEDFAQLRSYALSRAIDSGMTESEFSEGEHDDAEGNASYWIGWAFDAGTPEGCGFQIEASGCEEN